MKVLLLGATGTIGASTARALQQQGHETVCVLRAPSAQLPHVTSVFADPCDPRTWSGTLCESPPFDAVISCLASRTGTPRDAWRVDYQAHIDILEAVRQAGIKHFVLLSAICVQKPRLAFQKAKLRFEQALMASGMTYSIVRPTAYFKSLSGQLERVKNGKSFLVFGDGLGTACKPISDRDLADYLT
ncbi:MAG: NAD(P)H-binding protein, partial [Burkholderiaceae bacterium]